MDLYEADSNQPAAGVARETENLEKQQVPIEVQQQARVAREAEIPEKQQVPTQVQQMAETDYSMDKSTEMLMVAKSATQILFSFTRLGCPGNTASLLHEEGHGHALV